MRSLYPVLTDSILIKKLSILLLPLVNKDGGVKKTYRNCLYYLEL